MTTTFGGGTFGGGTFGGGTMAGWGTNWGFDWGNGIEDAAVFLVRVQSSAIINGVTVTTPNAFVALSRIAMSANVRVPNVNSTNVVTFIPGQPFAIRRDVTFNGAISRRVTAETGS